ncbi:hypothetical protein [Methylocystis echinoides]|uniref:Transposase n=1 Tax=Methylocystis echinoides TaxID=29468 RepID=A0A9W6GY47_9HYPH|nr:hypothetical protein LMG27198_41100 [Methylocystis echinoides]
MSRQPGLFDLDERYRKLSEVGDPLMRLKELIDFEVFRPALATAVKRSNGAKGGRPAYDAVLMFMYGCPRSRKVFFVKSGRVIGCGHVSGLLARPDRRWPVWRFADLAQIKIASFALVEHQCISKP